MAGNDHFLQLTVASGIALFDTTREPLSPVIAVEPEHPTTPINDGRCDLQGRFVCGMFNQAADSVPICHFHRVHGDLTIERRPLPPASVGNSIAFSPDGRTLYYAGSPTLFIYSATTLQTAVLVRRGHFAHLSASDDYPDGSTVDVDSGLWNAQWQGDCMVRCDPAGHESARFPILTSQPTSVAFGGALLDQLYVTSARIGLSDETLGMEPLVPFSPETLLILVLGLGKTDLRRWILIHLSYRLSAALL